MAFSGVVYVGYEHQVWGLGTHVDPVDGAVNSGAAAVEKYLTGYLVEKSLSIDNIFVMSTIFTALAVPALAVVLLIVGGKCAPPNGSRRCWAITSTSLCSSPSRR